MPESLLGSGLGLGQQLPRPVRIADLQHVVAVLAFDVLAERNRRRVTV